MAGPGAIAATVLLAGVAKVPERLMVLIGVIVVVCGITFLVFLFANRIERVLGITDKFGTIDRKKAQGLGFEVLPGDAWIEQEVDILIPAALENQVRGDNAVKISKKVRLIAEGANGPTTPEADEVLKKNGTFVVPDFLANAGGVTCSYFEQVQSNMNYYWERDEVLSKLDVKMTSAFNAVHDVATRQKLFMRDAAYVVAINRVAQACRDRGWV